MRAPALLALLALAAAAAAPPAAAQPAVTSGEVEPYAALRARIDAVLDAEGLRDAHWGVLAVDLATGDTLYARNAEKNFIPASNQKLLSTAAALDALGPDFRYETGLYLWGDLGRDGTLRGHLLVRGSGDPTIGGRSLEGGYAFDRDPTWLFRRWADSLRAVGVARVTDHVVGDDTVFDDLELGNGWAWDDVPGVYAAEVSGLPFNEGRLQITVEGTRPGRRADVTWEPFQTDYVYVVNRTETVASGGTDREVERERGGNTFRVATEVPAGRRVVHTVAVHNPTRYFVHTLRAVLGQEGLGVGGDAVDAGEWREPLPDYDGLRRVATYRSPPLAEVAAVTNKESINVYAESLLKTLGALRCDAAFAVAEAEGLSTRDLECGSARAGLLAARPFFERAGLDVEGVRLRDGSGMTHYNMISPADLVALLRYMNAHPDPSVAEAFVQSLAVGGVDGTLGRRFTSGRARGRVYAKTGTVTGAKNLSGYVTTAAGTPVAFSILTNQFSAPTGRVTAAQDAVVQLLADIR